MAYRSAMSWLLHLSDLHLGSGGAWELGDYNKSTVIRKPDSETRVDLLRSSLAGLADWLRAAGIQLDGIVVSGDVTYQCNEDGLAELATLLALLGDRDPGASKTMVVPGNHDVFWEAGPGTQERYQRFITSVRDAGYVTPLLEGVDIDPTDGADMGSPVEPLLDLGDVLLIAVNSSNYCGAYESLGEQRPGGPPPLSSEEYGRFRERAAGGDEALGRLLNRFDELRQVDMCRMSKGQTAALKRRLDLLNSETELKVRVAVLHHQLLPVNVTEEVKPYETMVNLGSFRQWLFDIGVHVVLHGHKHSSKTYVDMPGKTPFVAAGEHLGNDFVMVSSAATANTEVPPEIAKLVEIDRHGSTTQTVTIYSVPPTKGTLTLPGGKLPTAGKAVFMSDRIAPRIKLFEGAVVDAVYQQLLAAFPENSFDEVNDVICRVINGESCATLPTGYPVPAGEQADRWFKETVEWWQNPNPQLRPPQFNHGQQIWNAAHNVDQFSEAIRELRGGPTSRAIITLIDPTARSRSLFPALCTIHLRIASDGKRLDCVGYFRKQQMRAWWAINVGELASIQRRAVAELSDVEAGEIVTISSVAIGGSDRPRVAVPRID